MALTVTLHCAPLVLEYFDAQDRLLDRTEELAYTMGDPITVNQPNADPDYDVRLLDGHTHYCHVPDFQGRIMIRWFMGSQGIVEYMWEDITGPVEYRSLELVFNFYQDIDAPVLAEATFAGRPADRTVQDLPWPINLKPMGSIVIAPDPAAPWDVVSAAPS